MEMLAGLTRAVAAAAALALAHWAARPDLLPALAAAGGTAAAMAVSAALLLAAAAAPFALGAARGLGAVLGAGMILRGAALAAPWMIGPALPMGDAAALAGPLALAAAGAVLLARCAGRPEPCAAAVTSRSGAPRSRA